MNLSGCNCGTYGACWVPAAPAGILTGCASLPCCAGLVFWQMSGSLAEGARSRQALLYFNTMFGTYYGK